MSATASLLAERASTADEIAGSVMTVRGPIRASDMGLTLSHEHLLASFQPYVEWEKEPARYDVDDVLAVVRPHLARLKELGCRTFVDATAVGLLRDAALLKRVSQESGLHILTNTGAYAAGGGQYLPTYVATASVDALARRWIDEIRNGIEGTGVRPGFIKLGFNGSSLNDAEQKLIRAAAIAHRETGLTIGAHTGPAVAAFEQLSMLESAGVDPSAWIWIHAHAEPDLSQPLRAAQRGAWISFDHVSTETIGAHVRMVARMRDEGQLDRVLVSQDAGWYHVGQPHGGSFRPFDTVFTAFIPALRTSGFGDADIDTLFVRNPARAFAIRPRRRAGA